MSDDEQLPLQPEPLSLLKPPRVLFTPFLMGRPLGLPHQRDLQLATIQLALNLLTSATSSPTFENFIQ